MAHLSIDARGPNGQTVLAPTSEPAVWPQVFAGRLGGNQQFAVSPSDPHYDHVVSKKPDAARDSSWKAILDLRGFFEADLYRLAAIEGIGTMLQTYISGLLGVGLLPTVSESSIGAVLTVTYGAITNLFLISLFIYAAGPITGAHFNPLITMATFFTKLSSLPRSTLYIVFQCAGAVLGAFLLRASLGASPEQLAVIPGCYIDTSIVTPGEAYATETMVSLVVLFLAFGLGLDPRNGSQLAPALTPLLIGFLAMLVSFAGGIARKGYLGASNNPARCLGLMSAGQRFDYHYIHWVGDISAALLVDALIILLLTTQRVNGILYAAVPPYKK